MRGRSAVGQSNRGVRGRSAVGRRGRGVREDATPGRRDGSAHLSAFARRTRTAKAPTAQRTALFIAPSLSSDTSAPGEHADAPGKLSNLIADMPPHPERVQMCRARPQPYCRHAPTPERVQMRRASSPTLLPTCPDPEAHADAPPKAPFPTTFRQPPPAARPDGNFRQDSPPGQESRAALPVPSKRPALVQAGPFARQRASIRRQSPHACGRSHGVQAV